MNISYSEFLEKVKDKLSWVKDEVDFVYPYSTIDGLYKNCKVTHYNWTVGFYGGIMWYLYQLTNDDKYKEIGKVSGDNAAKVLSEFFEISHDLGFQFLCTAVAEHKIDGDKTAKNRAIRAATLLAGRFNPVAKYIRAWDDNPCIDGDTSKKGYAIIDCMMNLPLLYWASNETEDPRFRQIANIHADTVIKHFIRPDGSSNHIVDFDPETGDVVATPAGQGYAVGSAWTRGQAWAIYGFAMAYHYTGKQEYLDTAKRVAAYFVEHMTEDYVPIDFAQPKEPAYQDTSAAAICACGLLEIMKYVSEEEKESYGKWVDRLMNILYNNCDFTKDDQAVLHNCSAMYHCNEDGIHIPFIYGDFYLLEALIRLNGGDVLFYTED